MNDNEENEQERNANLAWHAEQGDLCHSRVIFSPWGFAGAGCAEHLGVENTSMDKVRGRFSRRACASAAAWSACSVFSMRRRRATYRRKNKRKQSLSAVIPPLLFFFVRAVVRGEASSSDFQETNLGEQLVVMLLAWLAVDV